MIVRRSYFLPALIVLALLHSCSPYPDHKQIAADTYIKLHVLGEGDELPQDGDSLLLRVRISEVDGDHGSIFSTENWYAVKDLRYGSIALLLQRSHQGDSLSMICPADRLPWEALLHEKDTLRHSANTLLRTEISIRELRTSAQMKMDEERLRLEDPMRFEQELLGSFIPRLGTAWQRWGTSDIHYNIQGAAIDTAQVKAGDIVTISYIGKRIEDGSTFDSSDNNGMPYTFRFGDEDQVIQGVEVAISLLREGQEIDIVLPSIYAFGDKGVEGKIAPYTPVLYSVRLEHVERSKRKV